MIVDGYGPKGVKPIALDELEMYLWGAAVLLRGQIDATSYKEYIFPLVFFKRICDVFDEVSYILIIVELLYSFIGRSRCRSSVSYSLSNFNLLLKSVLSFSLLV